MFEEDIHFIWKICSEWHIGNDIIRSTTTKVLKLSKLASFMEICTNLLIITFVIQADKLRVMEGRPSLFDNNLFILKPFDGFIQPHLITSPMKLYGSKCTIFLWPVWTENVAKKIRETIGKMIEVDVQEDGVEWGNYLRVKNLTKVLSRDRTINLQRKQKWVPLKYEKLPPMCFKCGQIMHGI